MKITHNGQRFEATQAYDFKEQLKAHAWRWNPENKTWWTESPVAAAPMAAFMDEATRTLVSAVQENIQASHSSEITEATIDIPAPAGRQYRPFQSAGIAYAERVGNALIGDEMGLGKTIQAIGILNLHPEYKRIAIVCPLSLKRNWEQELRAWATTERETYICTTQEIPEADEGIWLMHPAVLQRRRDDLEKMPTWDIIVVDEAHQYKSQKAQRTRALRAMDAKRKIALTGTPVLNHPAEIWTTLHWLAPTEWGSYWSFAKKYNGLFSGRYGVQLGAAQNLPELQTRLRGSCMVRRLKSEVLKDLPPKIRQLLPIEPTAEIIAAVNMWEETEDAIQIEIARIRALMAESEGADYKKLAAELKTTQGSSLAEISRMRKTLALAKVPIIVEHAKSILDEDETKKIAIWAHHHEVIDALREGLAEYRPVSLDGRNTGDERAEAVATFENNVNVRVFVGGIQAAGVGLTITSTSHAIFAELDWVPANISQAEDRHHRIGQTDSVLIQHLVVAGTLDARMVQAVIAKQDMADAALDIDPEEIILTGAPAPEQPKASKLDRYLDNVTAERAELVLHGLRLLASMDTDHARFQNGAGFNGLDTYLGHELARRSSLSTRQAALGASMLRKYHGQLDDEINEAVAGILGIDTAVAA